MNVQTISQTSMRRPALRRLIWLMLVTALLLSLTGVWPAYAAGSMVNSLADTIADDGACTLREAITNANNDDQSGSTDCAPGSGADTISFSVDGTIALGATLPEINSDMAIDGDGVTLDGQDSVRVFRIGSIGQATITNMTITRGRISEFGGGIFNDGHLTLANALLINNFGGPGGGALHNSSSGVATVRNTTFESNSGETGGAIHNDGDITITYSTFNGNIKTGSGAGASVADFRNMWIGNTIFANSINDTHCFSFGRPSSLGYNLSDDGSCPFSSTGDLNGVDALLGPLADNGGHTQTHALLAGSPALDHIPAGVNDCGTTIISDQRGVTRPQGTGCDIGAFEAEFMQPGTGFPTTSILDDFNRANGRVGGNWVISNGRLQYKIASQQLDVQLGGALIWKPDAFGTSQEAFITLQTIDPRSPTQGLLLKAQAGDRTEAGVIIVVYDARAKAVRVSTLTANRPIWTNYGNTAASFADGDQLGARALADGTVEVYQNGSLIATVTLSADDQAFFNDKGGRIGIWTLAARNAILDDFGGGDVALP